MSRTRGGKLLLILALAGFFSLAVLWPGRADTLRNGTWYSQPEKEKGTTMFEKLPPWWRKYLPAQPVEPAEEQPAAPPSVVQPVLAAEPAPESKIELPVAEPVAQKEMLPPEPKPTEPPAPFEQEQPEAAPVEEAAPESPDPLENIYFDYDKSELRPAAIRELNRLAAELKAKPDAKARIVGHCDAIGSDAYNDALSLRRAEAAKRYLMETHGIAPGRINIIGRGKREPAAPNETPEGRQFNRRGEFTIE